MTQDEFIKWWWSKERHSALLDTELGQNGQFDELAYVAWDEWKARVLACPHKTVCTVTLNLNCDAPGAADYLDTDPCCPEQCERVCDGKIA